MRGCQHGWCRRGGGVEGGIVASLTRCSRCRPLAAPRDAQMILCTVSTTFPLRSNVQAFAPQLGVAASPSQARRACQALARTQRGCHETIVVEARSARRRWRRSITPVGSMNMTVERGRRHREPVRERGGYDCQYMETCGSDAACWSPSVCSTSAARPGHCRPAQRSYDDQQAGPANWCGRRTDNACQTDVTE